MALQTKGFSSTRSLNRHFGEHGAEFSALNAHDYERMADEFLGGTVPAVTGVQQYPRSLGDILRYDPKTETLGIKDANDVIRTFFRPIPCASLPAAIRASYRAAGKCHPHPDNQTYVLAEAAKW